jgi:prepilin signal peptidase PulO-like enzyme (type II secretory pathway)
VVSWIGLLGKCRYCKKPISWQYPIIELLTGFLFTATVARSGLLPRVIDLIDASFGYQIILNLLALLALLAIVSIFILIALHDFKTGYVLSKYVYIGIATTLVYLVLLYFLQSASGVSFFLPYILSAAIPAVFYFLLYFLSDERWMGSGDSEIVFFMGLFLGWPKTLVAHYFAFIAGSIVGLALVFLTKKAKMKSHLPFAPFLVAGTFFAFIFGEQLFHLYVKIFLGG